MNRKLKLDELERPSVNVYKELKKLPVVVVLDNIRSLSNIGSAFRTCDAFLIEKIFLCGITARPPHREIQKTALGATQSVDWEYIDSTLNCIHQLKKNGYTILSVEQTQQKTFLDQLLLPKGRYALIFGNEVSGVQQDIIDESDFVVEIPQQGTKHSLNVAVSLGIACWEVFKQLKAD